jgi:hypothetical protein
VDAAGRGHRDASAVAPDPPDLAPDLAPDLGGERCGDPDLGGGLLRPYALTCGWARARAELEIESLVRTTSLGESAARQALERRAIVLLCRQPRAVAELSALLHLRLGLIRVLVGDLEGEGLVQVRSPAWANHRPDRALLQRVLDGLRWV